MAIVVKIQSSNYKVFCSDTCLFNDKLEAYSDVYKMIKIRLKRRELWVTSHSLSFSSSCLVFMSLINVVFGSYSNKVEICNYPDLLTYKDITKKITDTKETKHTLPN